MAANKGLTLRQFVAVLHKNFILQTRGRRSVLGSGWGAVLLQILLPVAFFSLMCIPKYYIQPYEHPAFLQPQEYDVDTKWWAGASPYEGPALSAGNNARIVFVPDTPAVASLASRVAMAVSCPAEPYKRICSPASITTFACMFGVGQAPASCQNSTACMTTPACYQAALSSHLRLLPDEAAALQLLREQPGSVDAVVVFPEALAAAKAAKAAAAAAAAAGDGAGRTRVPSASKRSRRQMAAADHVGHGSSSSSSSSAPSAAESGSLGCGTPGNADGDGLLLDYVIRMNGSDVPPTQLLQDLFDVSPGIMPLPGNLLWEYRRYWFFLNLQLAIDRALLGGQQSNASLPAGLTLKLKPFPWPAKQEDIGAASAAALLNLLLVYAFMAPTRAVVGSIVREKELRLREGMRILGLSEAAYWASWSLTHWLTLAASGLLCALVGAYPFRHSSLALMTAFYWLFSAALISFSYFLSTLFTASRVAGTATQFVYALSMIPGFLLPFVRPYGGISWYLACLSPTSAASLMAAALLNWERVAAGVTLQTLWLPVTQGSSFCVGSVLLLLAADVLLFAALTWYSDKVMPTSYGQHEQPDTSSSSSPYVDIVGLRRTFIYTDGSTRVAVEGLNMQMSAGRITALLGHNGAGKTTTIHMLTGMLQPTAGTAYIAGHDITTSMAAIRRSLGICPQFDILWPDISVREHLGLYAVIKGASWAEAGGVAEQAAAEVGLSDKLQSLAGELSGGQRRKLSVAIAFLGNPAVVFLDEPSSGMDPYSRRATWDVIRRRRHSSVIVLTTHSMEEADLLADDIHILAEGRLVASGSSLSLKAAYGDAAAAFPAALRALDAAAGELGVASYGLSVTTLEEVFLAIADQAVPLHTPAHTSSSSSSTTDAGSGRPSPVAGRFQSTPGEGAAAAAAAAGPADAGDGLVHGAALYWQQFRALFVKRMLSARRDRLAVITQLLVPLLLVLLAMAVSSLQTTTPQQPPLPFTRKHCLMGSPALLAAAPSVRQQVEFRGFMDGYPRSQIVDTQYTQLYRGSSGPPLNLTLEGQLLAQWDSGSPHYDAVYFHSMPPLDQLLSSLQGSPVITLLVNQSAVSGLPAALNQATTALLRVMVAAGGARKSGFGNSSSSAHPNNYSSQQAHLGAPGIASAMQGPPDPAAAGGGGGHLPSCLPDIRVASAPLPLLSGEAAERVRQDAGALMLVLCMTMAASVLSASFVVFLVREQENNSKHLQMVSGAPPTAFWLSNFAWDLLNFSLPAAGILGLVAWYNQPQLAGPRLAALAVLLAAFSGAGLTLTYLCHSMFKDEMKALQRLNTAYFLSGYLGFTTTWLLGLIARILGKQALAAATAQLKGLLRWLSPHYCFAQGLYDITSTYQGSGGLPVPGLQPHGPSNPFAFEVLGVAVLHLLGQTLLFGSAVLLLEAEEGRVGGAASQLDGQQLGAGGAVDDDVAAERQAVEAAEDVDEALVLLDGITKSYQQGYGLPPVAAISGLWLRVWPGECFGLLGVNGAGKTTTFKVLTGEVAPDSGDAAIAGHSVLTELAAARRRLGYCPQFEALPAALTGREVLHMYAALRGVQGRARIAAMAQQLLQELGLSQYADTVCGACSGGNKRKLSVAVALVGGPPLVLLDEPSTGMDPSARRFLWRVLQVCGGRTILLTSHSMEEVEALAGRLAIMAGGTARCIGTPQHLKSKFGDGYTLELRISAGAAAAAAGGGAAAGGDGGRVDSEHSQSTTGAAGAGAMDGDGGPPLTVAGGLAAAATATEVAEHHFMAVMPGAAVLEKEPGRLLLRLPLGSPAATTSSSTENISSELSSSSSSGVQGAAVVSSLADVFEAVEASRAALGITEYSLSQSSLERVFLSLAKAASCATDGE
ncbi:hypothetical protein OEZ85_008162 [Tetradesmus obliquus]|uniref:ABC transporter domain-containing protein n=1 Tax=Tetradesmus obliquus TaxID=3088 RepID=A0ABY8TI25_TETOB|nr:hypothetical protein OEZ85_008162 [Tetradesmus obliquus]